MVNEVLDLTSYINKYYKPRVKTKSVKIDVNSDRLSLCTKVNKDNLDDVIKKLDDSFSKTLFNYIDQKGLKDSEVYKKANIDRKLFSKIRNENYKPSKQTAICLAMGLELNLKDTKTLLKRAGYLLSHSSMSDTIVEFFITNKDFDLYKVDEALIKYNQKPISRY